MKSFLILFALITQLTQAQEESPRYRYELSGSLFYAYTYQIEKEAHKYPRRSVLSYERNHIVSFQPAVGYFILPEIELEFELRYAFNIQSYNIKTALGDDFVEDNYWDHTVGFAVGALYNQQITSNADIFLGGKIGLGWTRQGYNGYSYDSGWKKRELSFPIIVVGSRLFISPDWAILLKAQYSFTTPYAGYDNLKYSMIAVGLGFAVYL